MREQIHHNAKPNIPSIAWILYIYRCIHTYIYDSLRLFLFIPMHASLNTADKGFPDPWPPVRHQ